MDIVEQAREEARWHASVDAVEIVDNEDAKPEDYLLWKLADEIERLRAENEKLKARWGTDFRMKKEALSGSHTRT